MRSCGKGDSQVGGEGKKDLEFKSMDELTTALENLPMLSDLPEEVFVELAEYLQAGLNMKYRELAMTMYQVRISEFNLFHCLGLILKRN